MIEHDFQIRSIYDHSLATIITFLPATIFVPVAISNDPIGILAAAFGALSYAPLIPELKLVISVGPKLTDPELISILEDWLQQLEALGVRLIHINKDIGTERHTFRAEISPELNKVLLFLDGKLFFEVPFY